MIELTVVLGEISDIRDEDDRAENEGDRERELAKPLVPNSQRMNEPDKRQSKGREQTPRCGARVRAQASLKATHERLRAWSLR